VDDVDEEPDVIEFGIAALDARLESAAVTFPTTAAELDERFGHTDVPYDAAGNTIAFSDALSAANQERFDSERDLLNALHPVFEEKRQAASASIVSRLRALVPF